MANTRERVRAFARLVGLNQTDTDPTRRSNERERLWWDRISRHGLERVLYACRCEALAPALYSTVDPVGCGCQRRLEQQVFDAALAGEPGHTPWQTPGAYIEFPPFDPDALALEIDQEAGREDLHVPS